MEGDKRKRGNEKKNIGMEEGVLSIPNDEWEGRFDMPKGLHAELIGNGVALGSKGNTDRMQKTRYFSVVKAKFSCQLF